MDGDEEGWIYPLSAPSVPRPPYETEAEYILTFFEADQEALEYEIPYPLELAPKDESPRVCVWIGNPVQIPHSHDGYQEGMVRIRVKFDDKSFWYNPYMWVDKDEPLLAGQVYGLPKQMMDSNPLEVNGSTIRGVIKRRGQTIIRQIVSTKNPPQSRQTEFGIKELNKHLEVPGLQVKKVPSPEKNGKVLKQVVTVSHEDDNIVEVWEGDSSLEFIPNGYYPNMQNLEPRKIYRGFYVKLTWRLLNGNVLWEKFE